MQRACPFLRGVLLGSGTARPCPRMPFRPLGAGGREEHGTRVSTRTHGRAQAQLFPLSPWACLPVLPAKNSARPAERVLLGMAS